MVGNAPPPPSPEAQAAFLDLVENGMPPDIAAREIEGPKEGTETATRFKALAKRDPDFGAKYEAAREAGRHALGERAYGVYVEKIAFDEDKPNARALYTLLMLNHPDWKPLLEARTRHIHEGAVGIFALPQIDTSKWTIEQHEEFVALEARRNELLELARPDDAPRANGKHRELPAAPEAVEDAEWEEVGAEPSSA